MTPEGLAFVAADADGIGACKDVLVPRNPDGTLGEPSPVIEDAHEAGLVVVHGWTFRRENRFLPAEYRSGTEPNAPGDMVGEVCASWRPGWTGSSPTTPTSGAEAAERFGS